jgi:hypothetical protein
MNTSRKDIIRLRFDTYHANFLQCGDTPQGTYQLECTLKVICFDISSNAYTEQECSQPSKAF